MKTKQPIYLILVGGLLLTASSRGDSLWSEGSSRSAFADKKAGGIGDLLNIIVLEENNTKRDASSSTAKKSAVDASVSSFLYGTATGGTGFGKFKGNFPAMKFTGDTSFEGKGKVENTDSVSTRFGVRVIDVLPNHNFIVEGTRQTTYAGQSQIIVLRGTVRFDDIAANNTAYSYNLADVSIRYINSGSVAEAQRKGWLSRVWDMVGPF